MKNVIAKYKTTYQNLPRLNKIKKLWHGNYWDGPVSGMCLVDGVKCWFDCIEEWTDNNRYPDETDPAYEDFDPPWFRRFLIIMLSAEQITALEMSHAKFQRMVGTHCDYDENEQRKNYFHYNEHINAETVAQHYQEHKNDKPIDLTPVSEDYILGWYER